MTQICNNLKGNFHLKFNKRTTIENTVTTNSKVEREQTPFPCENIQHTKTRTMNTYNN